MTWHRLHCRAALAANQIACLMSRHCGVWRHSRSRRDPATGLFRCVCVIDIDLDANADTPPSQAMHGGRQCDVHHDFLRGILRNHRFLIRERRFLKVGWRLRLRLFGCAELNLARGTSSRRNSMTDRKCIAVCCLVVTGTQGRQRCRHDVFTWHGDNRERRGINVRSGRGHGLRAH